MTVYAPSNIDSVSISGSGHAHVRDKNEKNMSVTCVVCEPELKTMGWATDPRDVELTYDEIRDAEIAQQDIARFEQMKVAEAAREAAAAVRSAGTSSRARTTRGGAAR